MKKGNKTSLFYKEKLGDWSPEYKFESALDDLSKGN